ncbi:MAG: hypothetical protein ACE5R4_14840, partial [Armatimonadota bacterium]
MTSIAAVGILAAWGLLAETDAAPVLMAISIGIASHLTIDALSEGGIMTLPGPDGRWRRLALRR